MRSKARARQIGAVGVVAGAVAAGCSGAPAPELPEPGRTAVYVKSRIEAPCELSRLALYIDAGLTYAALPPHTPAADGEPKLVAQMPLPPGRHAVAVHATARCAGIDSGEQSRIMTLRDARSFLVGAPPAFIVIELTANGFTSKGGGRVDTMFEIAGGELAPAIGPAGTIYQKSDVDGAGIDDRHCTGLPTAQRAICRTEAVLDDARRQRDIVKFNCVQDKLAALRAYAAIIDRARERSRERPTGAAGEARVSAPSTVQANDSKIISIAEDRVRRVANEVDSCIGAEVARALGRARAE